MLVLRCGLCPEHAAATNGAVMLLRLVISVLRIHRRLVTRSQAWVDSLQWLDVIEHSNAELLPLPLLRCLCENIWHVTPLFVNLAEVAELIVHIQPIITLICILISQLEVIIQSAHKALIPLLVVILNLLLQTQSISLQPLLLLQLCLLVESLES